MIYFTAVSETIQLVLWLVVLYHMVQIAMIMRKWPK